MGIGWLKEEFEALGVPYEKRGARFDDYVAGMRKVWSEEVVSMRAISFRGMASRVIRYQYKTLPCGHGCQREDL